MREAAVTDTAAAEDAVLLEERAAGGGRRIAIATLNAPKSLHALTLGMIRLLDGALRRWASDESIACVVLRSSTDKAFCAGGDVRGLRAALLAAPGQHPNPEAQAFFAEEYRLDYRIHSYPKPVLAWGGGIVMGGGLGLLAGASHRVATETTRIAMPEVSIGLFPDVGGSWFLPRMPGRAGLFLGLTGAPLNAADALFTGLADYFLRQADLAPAIDALCAADWSGPDAGLVLDRVLRERAAPPADLPVSEVRAHFDTIQELTAPRALEDVVERIAGYAGESAWLRRAAATMAAGSPLSRALAWEARRRSRHMSLAEVFRMELALALGCCAHPDFAEGVRALLIDKDNAPRWQPASPDAVVACFAPPWTVHPLAGLEQQ